MHDVADVDAHAEFDDFVTGKAFLDLQGAIDCINHGGELDQPTIAHAFHHLAAMFRNRGLEEVIS